MLAQLVEALARQQGALMTLDDFVASCELECKRAERLYTVDDQLVESFLLIDTLERSFATHADELGEALEQTSGVMNAYESTFRLVRQRYGELQLLCSSYFCEPGWELAKNTNGLRTFYRHELSVYSYVFVCALKTLMMNCAAQ